ncbi:sugar transferase [bacterium]|nr:sugar transferase [FCB group bacterium]MBL7191646.1 sugar transferase [bacterium]
MNWTFIRNRERTILILLDLLALNSAFFIAYYFRFSLGILPRPLELPPETTGGGELFFFRFILPALVFYLYWLLLFGFRGLYKRVYGLSRLDAVLNVFRTTVFGCVIILVVFTFFNFSGPNTVEGKVTLLTYWSALLLFTAGGRFFLRTVQHHLLMRGIGLAPSIIIGCNSRALQLYKQTLKFPAMGYKVIGYVSGGIEKEEMDGCLILGTIEELGQIIEESGAEEALIALEIGEEELTEKVIGICNQTPVRIKILPDLYRFLSGQVKTMGLYGVPLVEVFPVLMTPWERAVKRVLDVTVSIFILAFTSPLFLLIAAVIKTSSKGPVIYTQRRVGKKGREFTLYKFRSMIEDAEAMTGAVWAEKNDPRITKAGKIIRRTRLDELPQFINVLKGDMSLVGPRPERKVFVEEFIKKIHLYSRRLNVKPGITGWAQIKHKYDESLDDVKVKLTYDLYYLENMSLRLDLTILLQTLAVVFKGKGQ